MDEGEGQAANDVAVAGGRYDRVCLEDLAEHPELDSGVLTLAKRVDGVISVAPLKPRREFEQDLEAE